MRAFAVLSGCVASLVLVTSASSAPAPNIIGYHGVLASAVGDRVSLSLPMTFRLYDSPNGDVVLWEETHSEVVCEDGLFDVELGSVDPLDAALFASGEELWLTLQVDTDVEMTPRQRLVSVPFALHASNADTVGGVSASSLEESAELSSAVSAHSANASAHHARYTDDAAILAVNLPGHTANASAHHARYTNTEAVAAVNADAAHGSTAQHDYTTSLPWTAITSQPTVLSSLNSVSNDEGNVNLIAGANVTISPDDGANTIAIGAPLTTFEVTQPPSNPINTTSVIDVVTDLAATPSAGTYLAFFSCSLQNSNAGKIQTVSLYVGGTRVAESERSANSPDANRPASLSTQAVVVVGAGDAVEVHWKTDANTATMLGRTLTLLRLW